jgi:LacI family transcriptional regulator
MTTIKDVANAAGVSPATVSAVVNGSAYVSPKLRVRVLEAVSRLGYAPSQLARSFRRGRSELIAIAAADLSNLFFSRVVWAAETAVAAWGRSLVVFNSDEKPEAEKQILNRVWRLRCEGLILVPVSGASNASLRDFEAPRAPTVLFGRTIDEVPLDTVTIDNFSASYQVTNYLIDLGHVRIGAVTGPLQLSTGRDRFEGMKAAMSAKSLAVDPRFVRSGEFREEVAYSVARGMFEQPERPTAVYVANGAMALGVLRAIQDAGLRCPEDISVASTDNIPGIRGLKPQLTRAEHPIVEMVNESVRLLMDRINRGPKGEPRNVVFPPTLVVGDSCAPLRK